MTDRPRHEWTKQERALERKALETLYGNKREEKTYMANDKQFDDTNRGAIFQNDQKVRDAQPDWSGPLNFEGTELRLAGWIREDRNGRPYISLKVERMTEAKEKTSAVRGIDFFENDKRKEDIPF